MKMKLSKDCVEKLTAMCDCNIGGTVFYKVKKSRVVDGVRVITEVEIIDFEVFEVPKETGVCL